MDNDLRHGQLLHIEPHQHVLVRPQTAGEMAQQGAEYDGFVMFCNDCQRTFPFRQEKISGEQGYGKLPDMADLSAAEMWFSAEPCTEQPSWHFG